MVKVKQVNVTANYAWSPSEFHPIQIVAGTAAQQLDASFSTTSNLSLYTVDLADPSHDLSLVGQIAIPNRFYKVIWGHGGLESGDEDSRGLVICGADNGLISIYDPRKLNDSSDNDAAMVSSNNKHTGPVKALDFNPFQKNLYASGASDSEIFIWDLKNPGNPMTPGKKTEPLASISCVAWNRQVQHILGTSTSVTSGPSCYVWDLRKNAPIIKVQDPSGRMQCSEIAWHPEVATQLVLASEDDRSPVVQALENHQRGVLSVAWCQQDPDLLISCGKDNRVLCWNPNATPPEVVYEAPNTAQWCFDVQWCPRNPAMISLGSFDGCIGIHSLMGGSMTYTEMPSKQQQDAITDSFGESAFPSVPVERPQAPKKVVSMPLKNPPKWLNRCCGASFSFGGKLVTFENQKPSGATQQQQQQPNASNKAVTIHQVVTETTFISRSEELQGALSSNQFSDYCQKKMESAETVFEEDLWSFMKAKFESEPRKQFLHLLGYDAGKIKAKISNLVGPDVEKKLSAKMDDLSTSGASTEGSQSLDGSDAFEMIAATQSSESLSDGAASTDKPLVIPSDDGDPESLISQALLVGDYESAVGMCLRENRMADAIVLAIAGGPQLLERTQKAYFARCESKIGRLMLAVATKNWTEIVTSCELSNWKEALATLLTYSSNAEMNSLCDQLGGRLEADKSHKIHACLCYVCSGNVDKLVRCWDSMEHDSSKPKSTPESLQDLIEKVMVLRKAVESMVGLGIGQAAAEKLASYASILASQGKLEAAMGYLPDSVDKPEIKLLKERLQSALGFHQRQQAQVYTTRQPGRHMQPAGQLQPTYNQPRYAQPGQMRTMNPVPVPKAPEQPTIPARTGSPSNNPYAANRRTQAKPGYVAPTNLYTPQAPGSSAVPPGVINGYNPSQPSPPSASQAPPMPGMPTSQPQQPDITYGTPARQPFNIPTDSPALNQGGWNDPPAVDPNRIPKKKKPAVMTPVAPMIHGFMPAVTPDPGVTLTLPPESKPAAPTFQPQNYNLMTPSQPAIAPTPMQPSMLPPNQTPTSNPYIMQQNGPPGAPGPMQHGSQSSVVTEESDVADEPRAPAPSMPTKSAKDAPKAPIPTEHQILQTQFESLIKQCLANASNPQTKRKLDDCERRMEFLYDKLRANTLSPNIVTGLHQVAQFIGAKDYSSGLRQHTHIVTSSNFSEISAFMPGLKSLLQIAAQLRV